MSAATHGVQVSRGEASWLVFAGSEEDAHRIAKELNEQYQTDEYRVVKLKGVWS